MLKQYISNLSLRVKATGLFIAITTLSLAIVASIGFMQIRALISAEEHRTAESMALSFARASELALTVRDSKELSRLVHNFLRDDDVLFIAAYGSGTEPLAYAARDAAAWKSFLAGATDPNQCIVTEHQLEASAPDEFLFEADPKAVSTRTDGPVGRVVVGLSTVRSTQAQWVQSRIIGAATVGAASAGAIVVFFLLGAWTRRLQLLAVASKSISRGDFSPATVDHHDDEIGRLAHSFEAMRVALQDRDLKLREFTGTLQDQVRQRTSDLEEALTRAEEASRAKSLFLANMSHELRTPLNGVIGMVDLLHNADASPQQRRYCEVAKTSAHSLLDLINDILDFSKIEAGKLDLDTVDFDLHELVEGVAVMHGERAQRKNVELICSIAPGVPHFVGGDPGRLRQVISNLLSNAIKFTEKGEVLLAVRVEAPSESQALIHFSITDSGIGIPQDRMDRLFKSFSQIDSSTSRKFGGTGLGLAISHRIVEMMGGRIGVESHEGTGSTFWFTVHLEKRAQTSPPPRPVPIDVRGLRVLAVDDNTTNRDILKAQLASWNLRADIAASAEEAITMLQAAANTGEHYHLAILDMHMPRTDGMQLAREIKSNPATRDLVLISLSSISDLLKPREMKELGFAACLTKPALPSQLYNAIVDSVSIARDPSATADAVRPAGKQSLRLDGVRILLAEDNEVNRFVASELLLQAGSHCVMVTNGREAIEELARGSYEIVLMDCQMPELDGFAATKLIRQKEHASAKPSHIPIIALTANAIMGDRERCLAAGMDGYVTKPIDPVELFQTIRTFLAPDRVIAPLTNTATVAEKAVPAAESQSPPIDLESLQKRCMGNRKLAAKALSRFNGNLTSDIQSLIQNVQNGDAKAAAAAAHKIKGAAANLSADHVRDISARLESLAMNDELAQAQTYLDQLEVEMNRFRDYLGKALNILLEPESSADQTVPTAAAPPRADDAGART